MADINSKEDKTESHKVNNIESNGGGAINHTEAETDTNAASTTNHHKYRTTLPVPMLSRKDFSVWTFLKSCIGKELSKITMPVIFNEPLSFVQRLAEYMEYSSLLDRAVAATDPVTRMEYIAAFAVSSSASNWERVGKPFNPYLGETYELVREDMGFRFMSEQVSHHPPVSAYYADNDKYSFHGSVHPKLKFWGKSVEVTPKGTLTLHLKEHGEVYTWSNIICCVHNIIVGKLWIEHYGTMEIVNHSNGLKTVLHFRQCGWFGNNLHKVDGYMYDKNKKKLKAFYGKWVEALYSHDVKTFDKFQKGGNHNKNDESSNGDAPTSSSAPTNQNCDNNHDDDHDDDPKPQHGGSTCDLRLPHQRLLWQAKYKTDGAVQQYYSFTEYAIMLNEISDEADRAALPDTDSRLRDDIRRLEEADLSAASDAKHTLEERQRALRKQRKEAGLKWSPRYFEVAQHPQTGKDEWVYKGNYWKEAK